MTGTVDVIIVGSGPAGAMAASVLVQRGHSVRMIDAGFDDENSRASVPDLPFSRIRSTDPDQKRFFLGLKLEGVPRGAVKIGSQLTPPRQFASAHAETHLKYVSENFHPMQSLALGGLGSAWGAAVYTYDEDELRKIGIRDPEFSRYYDEVAGEIGVSGSPEDDSSAFCFKGLSRHQPPCEIDTNSSDILGRYLRKKAGGFFGRFHLGRMSLAMLSRDFKERKANPYFDMDFWSDSRKSIYRPRYTVEELRSFPNFTYSGRLLATQFAELADGNIDLRCTHLDTQSRETVHGRRLILCAGAINSARLALNSIGTPGGKAPILCNPYTYIPCINLGMFGRKAADRRHSMAQLCAIYRPDDDPDDYVSLQFYSYRSLLQFKLVKELPLPVWAGLLLTRLLLNCLTIVGVHHSSSRNEGSWIGLKSQDPDRLPELEIHYSPESSEEQKRVEREKALSRILRSLLCLPCARIAPGHASSIHYAGTLSESDATDGRLKGTRNVFLGDSASWKFLPAKGLTFTLMANARRIARLVSESLASS